MSIQRLKSGKYQVRYRDGLRNRARAFDLKRDAQAFEGRVKHEKQTRGVIRIDRGVISLAEFAPKWWESQAKPNLVQSTCSQYKSLYNRHILNQLGHYELRQIRPIVLVEWKSQLQEDVPPHTLSKTYGVLKNILSYAVLAEEIETNPLREVPRPSAPKKIACDPLSPSQVEAVRRLLRPRDATLVSVLAYLGLRPGEALRMSWEDIGDNSVRVFASKTQKERAVPLPAVIRADLLAWQLQSGRREGLVFGTIDWKNWRNRIWNPAFDKAGLEGETRPYRLRSSFVSLMIADPSNSIFQVARWAGHTLKIMDENYAGILQEFDGRNINAEQAILKARESKEGHPLISRACS